MRSNYLIVIALSLCGLLIMFDVQQAYAFSITVYDSVGDATSPIVRLGNKVFIGDSTLDTVYVRSVDDLSVNDAIITGVTLPLWGWTNQAGTRVYMLGTTLYEIDPVNDAVLRTFVTGCSSGWFSHDSDFLWCSTSTETVKKISLASMTDVFTSTTLNAGATPCDTISDLWYDTPSDTLFASCVAGTNRIVVVEGITASGTPDFAVTLSSVREIVFNNDQDNVAICSANSAVTAQLYDYTAGVGLVFNRQLISTGSSNVCSTSPVGGLEFDETSNRFFILNSANESINVFDATNGDSLFGNTFSGGFTGGQVYVFSNTLSYLGFNGASTSEDFAEFDMTGIALGSGGEDDPDSSGGIDCTLPENAQILICRLGSDPNCNGTVLGCVGNTVIGSANDTSDTGLIDVICGVGFIDCNANPDIRTNGIGYLLLAVALGIEIGILWVASRGDLRQVPTFIWFIATIAIIAALTLFNWIDATMLVLGVIVAVALAAAKARGFFGGDSF